ncbi:oxysterol-binding -related 5 isoform X2 [Chlorella sorokiniana]|uniref:Oxysterol-binding-related 5 isoform X2 n=1 Tax=Chlorella sorokiniana TaxID=3076 RepID=A0A2P6TCN1_CHLSO|nr:oxysterol-binding -related 5 isoform X2 [Chlorella sorokiniana]|eukprot:PRW20386.1 oxysterol-binding -related 5 isoform X2 [Chlorella sorokiniana]
MATAAPGAPRAVFKPGGGRSKAAAPDPTKQQDRHTTLSGLLLRAEAAPDPLERMLAVCRALLYVDTDLLRPGRSFGDTPTAILGQHYLSKRQLAEKHRGDAMHVFLQELCSHEPLPVTQHAKYTAAAAAAPAAGAATSQAAPAPAATLQLRFTPSAVARQQQSSLRDKLPGGGKGSKSSGADKGGSAAQPLAWVECALEGEFTVTFPRHAETYTCMLPALVLAAPLAQDCPLDLAGMLTVGCEATGLAAELAFRPFRGGAVQGAVGVLSGKGHQAVASIAGSWQGVVTAESVEGSGVLFDAAQYAPPLSLTINLAQPGPRAATRLWTALLESLVFVSAAEGKRAEELAAALPPHLRHSLLFEVESSGLKPKAAAAAEEDAAAAAATGEPGAGLLPPCVLAHRSSYGGRLPGEEEGQMKIHHAQNEVPEPDSVLPPIGGYGDDPVASISSAASGAGEAAQDAASGTAGAVRSTEGAGEAMSSAKESVSAHPVHTSGNPSAGEAPGTSGTAMPGATRWKKEADDAMQGGAPEPGVVLE